MAAPEPVAVGCLGVGGPWVGFVLGDDGYRLACAVPHGVSAVSPSEGAERTDELLAAAIAHYEEALEPPPAELEATQADLGGMLRWLAATETDPARRRVLLQAVDAVDDGLAGDAVVGRLTRARQAPRDAREAGGAAWEANEQADLVDLLAIRCASLGAAIQAPGD